MTAMDFRQYDQALGRFNVMDALSEMAYDQTPYRYGFNNPVFWKDPSGLFETHKQAAKFLSDNGLNGSITYNQDFNGYVVTVQGGEFDGTKFYDFSEVMEDMVIEATSKRGGGSSESDGWINTFGQYNTGLGFAFLAVEEVPGSFRLSTTKRGFSPFYYKNAWRGNQYAKTFNIAKIGKGLGNVSTAVGIVSDMYGVRNYYKFGEDNENAVHPGEAATNLSLTVYGIWVNPAASLIYGGVEAFYPGGFSGMLQHQNQGQQENQKILGNNWRMIPFSNK